MEDNKQLVIFNSVSVMIWFKDTKNNFLKINNSAAKMMGMTVEEIEGKSVYDLLPEEAERHYQDDLEVINSGKAKLGIIKLLQKPSGEKVWLQVDKEPYRDEKGKIIGVVVFAVDITDSKQAQEKLKTNEQFINDLLDNIEDTFYVFDAQGNFIRWNKTLERISGYSHAEISKMKPTDFFTKESAVNVIKAIRESFEKGRVVIEEEFVTKDGRMIPMYFSGSVIMDLSHQPILCGTGKNITELKQKEEALHASEVRYRTYIEVTGQIGWITLPDGIVEDMPEWRKYTGQSVEEVKGWGWLNAIHPDDRELTAKVWNKAIAEKSTYETEYRIRRHDGVYRYFLARGIPALRKDGTILEWVGTCIDITERKQAEDKLKELSLRDSHTELYNYRYLMERLELEVKMARKDTLALSVIMLDIDYFKSINDVYGHQCGDIILKEFAQCLKDFVRNADIVARYGGEEFVIVLPGINKNDAILFSESLLDMISKHLFDAEGKKIKLKVSIGLANFPEDGGYARTASGLIDLADKALLDAKEKGGNKLRIFKDTSKNVKGTMEKGAKVNVKELREKLSKMSDRVDRTMLESVYAFAKIISAKDYYTGEHADNMVSIVVKIGKELNLSSAVIKTLGQAAILHDLGKVGVPDNILHKKEKLTKEDYEIVKKHPQIGAEIIRPIHILEKLVPMILHHHERFDGLGYSSGLKGKEIPLGARIIAIADWYQALVSDRPYRKAYSKKEAIYIIKQASGTQFDPEIVKAFLVIIK